MADDPQEQPEPDSPDRPVFDSMKSTLSRIANAIGKQMPPGCGFTLLLYQNGPGGFLTYASSSERTGMIRAMHEFLEHQEPYAVALAEKIVRWRQWPSGKWTVTVEPGEVDCPGVPFSLGDLYDHEENAKADALKLQAVMAYLVGHRGELHG